MCESSPHAAHCGGAGSLNVPSRGNRCPVLFCRYLFPVLLLLPLWAGFSLQAAAQQEPSASFASVSSSAGENAGEQNVTVNFSPALPSAITLNYSVDGTATINADYVAVGVPSASAGATSMNIRVQITDDSEEENDETVTLTLQPGAGYEVGSPSEHTLTITDNDGPPEASFASTSSSAGENAGAQNVTVNFFPAPPSAITLNYSVDGTATSVSDYAALSGEVQVSANATSANIPVSIVDDASEENDETVVLTLTSGADYEVGSPSEHTLTITDNDGAPSASFASASSSAGENAGAQNVTVNFFPAPPSAITLNYSVDGTATSVSDYAALSGEVQVSANATSANIPVSIVDDASDENDETVVLTLTSGAGYEVGSPDAHTLTIRDDDSPQVRFASASSSAGENAGAQNVTVNFSPAPPSDITLNYSVDGTATSVSDYAALSGEVQVSANATSANIPVSIVDDASDENNETVVLTLTSGAGYEVGSPSEHTLTITDNDGAPSASFASASSSAGENAGAQNVTVNFFPAPPSAITLNYSVDGTATSVSDYAALSGEVQVSANATSANIPVSIVDDASDENDETVVLTLTSGAGYEVGSPSQHTLTITDNDDPPAASFASASSSVTEGADVRNVTVNLSPAPLSAITLNYSVDGTAASGADYAALSGEVQVSANAASVNIPVSISDDSAQESSETVVLTLTSGAGYAVGSPDAHTLTIRDDDSPQIRFAAASSSANEGSGEWRVTVNLFPAPKSTMNLFVGEGAGTATEVADYQIVVGAVPAGATSVDILVTIIDDDLDEDDETLVMWLDDIQDSGYRVASPSEHALTIADNDGSPSARFASASSSADEGAGVRNVTVNFSPARSSAITLGYSVDGTASSGADYAALSGEVQVSANAKSVNIPVSITDDAAQEDSETVVLTLTPGAGYAVGSPGAHALAIEDNDTPRARFASASSSAGENAGAQNVTVNFSPALPSAITLNYSVDGTATSVSDYAALSGEVQVSANATSVNIPVLIIDDVSDENDETVVLTLTSGAGYAVGSPSEHTMMITDNDGSPSARFASVSSSASEDGGVRNVTVNLSPVPQSAITLDYTIGGTASAGADYAALSGDVQVSANAASVDIPVSITDDVSGEDDETVELTLISGSGYKVGSPRVHTLTITDNEMPAVSFASVSSSADEGAGTYNVTVNLSPAPQSDIPNINYSTDGTATINADYVTAGVPSASAGATSMNILVQITDDSEDENDETVTLTLYPGAGYTVDAPSMHALTIADNDGAPSARFASASSSAGENAGAQNVTVNLSPAPQAPITLNYRVGGTASPGADYTALTGSIQVSANAASVDIPVSITDDSADEEDKTVVLTLTLGDGYAVGSQSVHTLIIEDDDGGTSARFASASESASESADMQSVTVNLSPAPQSPIELNYRVGGTASPGADYAAPMGSVQAPAGSARVDIPVAITEDVSDENDETLELTLYPGPGYKAGLPSVYTLLIQDNDGLSGFAPVVAISGGSAVSEGEDAAFTLTARPAPTSELSVNVTVVQTGSFGAQTGSRTVVLGASGSIDFTVPTTDDRMVEPDGSIRVTVDEGNDYTVSVLSSVEVVVTDDDGVTSAESAGDEIPTAFALEQNYPNPFNPSTTIEFSLDRAQRITLLVYDMLGREVRMLMEGAHPAARYSVSFDATGLASGTYFYVLRAEDQTAVRKMALLK